MSLNSKNKNDLYYDNIVNRKPPIVRSKFFKNVNNSTDNKNKSNESLTFNAITRVFMLALFTLIMVLGFTNGTLDFIQDHKEVYAVENYVKPNITSFSDCDGKTFKFNKDVILINTGSENYRNNFELDINLDYLSTVSEPQLAFTLFNSSNSYDLLILNSWYPSVNYRMFLNGYNDGLSFRPNGSLTLTYFGYYQNGVLSWNNSFFGNINDDFYISFSNDFSNLIKPAVNLDTHKNRFINFINYQTTFKNDIYTDDFYYYDWRFKLHQLSNFRPLFYYDDLDTNMKYSPYLYEERLQEYVDNGDITFVNSNYIGDDVVLQWKITDYGTNPLSYEIIDFLKYKVKGITGDSDTINPPPFISGLFILDNGDVRPRNAFIGTNTYDTWVERYENGDYLNANAFGFLDGVFGFLSLPINFSYNLYVFFDFILRW